MNLCQIGLPHDTATREHGRCKGLTVPSPRADALGKGSARGTDCRGRVNGQRQRKHRNQVHPAHNPLLCVSAEADAGGSANIIQHSRLEEKPEADARPLAGPSE
jgi:hypothetical protein